MRRPDLLLLLVAIALIPALALGVEDGPPSGEPQPNGAVDPSASPFAAPDPGLLRCLSGEIEPSSGDSLDPASLGPDRLVELVSAQVEELRELRFAAPVDARFLTDSQLRDRISELLQRERTPRAGVLEGDVLELLGAIPARIDLNDLEERALGSQVAGLYSPETRELLVRSSGEPGTLELLALAHELEHALADQRLGLRDDGGAGPGDRELAYLAVVEGDATLLMARYAVAHVGLAGQIESLGDSVPGAGQFEALPDYVQRSLLFPYLDGLRLVCARWLRGGWDAVDHLYDHPPSSTAEVISPERYGDRRPIEPRDPGRLPPPWRSRTARDLGPAELEWLFSAPGGDSTRALPDPRRLVSTWAGGELELWASGPDRALGIALAELPQAELLCGAMAAWYRAMSESSVSGGERADEELVFAASARSAVLACPGRQVRLGIAPDEATARLLVN